MGWLLSRPQRKAVAHGAEPGRDIDEEREAGGVGFGKAVFAEALDLGR